MKEKYLETMVDEALAGNIPGVVVVQPTEIPACCARVEKGEPVGKCDCNLFCMCRCCDCDVN